MSWLSYLFPITLYRGRTAKNTLIEVRELFGCKKLDLDGYPQSGTNYQRYWKHIFAKTKLNELVDNSSVLVLGLGGGDIVKLLISYQTNIKITAVELESEVVDVANKYFGIKSSPGVKILTEDAKKYMTRNKNKFEVVIVDLYNGDSIPDFVATSKFLRQVAHALKPEGVAIFNYASHSFRQKDFLVFEQKLSKVFSKTEQFKYMGHPFFLATL